MLIGSLLGLLAFLLAITMGMAADRFDTRRGLVLAEATTINTTYLRAGYLPEPYETEIRNLLREYVPLRIVPEGQPVGTLATNIAESERDPGRAMGGDRRGRHRARGSDIIALYIESVNEVITVTRSGSRRASMPGCRTPSSYSCCILAFGSTSGWSGSAQGGPGSGTSSARRS